MVPKRTLRTMSERFTVIVDVECAPDGKLVLSARPADPAHGIRVQPSVLAVTVWSDGPDVIRASVQHRRAHKLAYLQGNRALLEVFEQLGLELAPLAQPVDGAP
jgi:hypothetical protein